MGRIQKRIIWVTAGLFLLLAAYGFIHWMASNDLDDAEKVAVEFWTAEYFHYDKQTMDRLLSSQSQEDTTIKFIPIRPGTVWITSLPKGSNKTEVYMYISPELQSNGSLLKKIDLVTENGQWKVLDSKGIKTEGDLSFEAFQGTPQYQMIFGNAQWKEVTIH